tara:strand:+ start:132 stop:2459 length:2328 start_codon:yes stop_codon:yes gene_type:complete
MQGDAIEMYAIEPDGKPDANYIIIGESPGNTDIQENKLFAGWAGELLFDDILARAGIMRKSCLVTNVYWEKPPANKMEAIPDITKYADENDALIRKAKPKVIIACGEYALRYVTNETGITKWRGSVIETRFGCPCVPMIHPASVLRNYSWKALSRNDAQKARTVADNGMPPNPNRNIISYSTAQKDLDTKDNDQIVKYLLSALNRMSKSTAVAFDIETYRNTITCIGIADSETDAVVIPFTGQFNHPHTIELIRALSRCLRSDALKIGQNLDYDVQYLAKRFGIGVRNVWMDTMVAHSVMHPEMGHSLDLLTSLYTSHPYYKEMRKTATSGHYNATLWEYNGIDCCITYEVAMKLWKELGKTNTQNFFTSISMPVTKTLIRMEHRGVRVDIPFRDKRKVEMEKRVEDMIADPLLCGVNPNSPKQVLDHLKSILPKGEGNRLAKSDVHALKLLRSRQPNHGEFIDSILKVRELRKIIGTYLEAKTHVDRRMRTSYRTSATDTGRISSSKDVFNLGMNLQNVPGDQRDWFIPDEGKIFFEADGSQIEARITAWIAQDENYIRGFLEGRDIHTENAVGLFGIAEADARSQISGSRYSYRDVGKRASHAINYKIGPKKLKDLMNEYVPMLPFGLADANQFIHAFKDLRPGIARWWGKVANNLRSERTHYNIFGRRRVFLGRAGEDLIRAAVAFFPQSAAADHINRAMVRIESRLTEVDGAEILLQVHDSVAGQCFPEDLEIVKQIVIEELEAPLPIAFDNISLIVPADFASGTTWKDCK